MRSLHLLVVVTAAVLVGSSARGEEPGSELEILQAYGPFKAVGIMLETGQAMVWDEKKSEYRLVRVGEEHYGWKIVAIQREKVVIAQADGAREELTLTPTPTEIKTQIKKGAVKGQKRLAPTAVEITPDPVIVAKEPKAEVKAAPTPAAPKPEVKAATPAVLDPKAPQRYTLKRADLDREIADLDRLMSQVNVQPATGGGFVLTRMQSPFLAKIGIKEGDIVRTVAGETVTTVEDAARVYARLRTAKTFTVEVERAGARLSIRYDVTG
jgi:type II secretory pathway component PulC